MKLKALLLLALLLLAALWPAHAAVRAGKDRHVVLISLDGFAAYYLDDPNLPLPNIRGLMARGARADAMTVSTPSVTWPNHTTLVTGVSPARHGVLANGRIEPAPDGRWLIQSVRSKEELCRVPTLYDAAHGAGLRTAEVNWPVTRGARTLDWSFPDHPDPVRYGSPGVGEQLRDWGLLSAPTDAAFGPLSIEAKDYIWTQAAVRLLKERQPNLLLLHLLTTDSLQHGNGPRSSEAYAALALADRLVGDVLQAVRESRLDARASVFVVADHGFITYRKLIQPNARLAKTGFITGSGNAARFQAHVVPEGGLALVYVNDPSPDQIERVRQALNGLEGVEAVLTAPEFTALGMPAPGSSAQAPHLVLAAKDGYAFGGAFTGEEVVATTRAAGAHGYPHTYPKMDAAFVAAGAGIRRDARVPRVRNVDVAPTIARLLGIEMGAVEGAPLDAILQ